MREALAAALTLDGYDVQTAPDGQELREVVARMVGPEILRRPEIHRVSPGR